MMNKKQKKLIGIVSIVTLVGFLGLLSITAHANTITITFPANQATWSTVARPTTQSGIVTGQRIIVQLPAHDVQSRIILGTNANPGAATRWWPHRAHVSSNAFHPTGARVGTNVRAQFRTAASQSRAFTSGGAWHP